MRHLGGDKWVIVKFINFQYGKLSQDCKPHRPVFAALEKHGLNASQFYQSEEYRGLVDGYMRDKIIARDGGMCVYTGVPLLPSEIAIDHVVPRSKGGASKPHNLVSMDAKLNSLKSDLTVEEFCKIANLDIRVIRERLSNSLSKSINTPHVQDKDNTGQEEDKNKKKGTLSELQDFCRNNGLFPRDADYLWNRWESNGWQNANKPIRDWRATVRAWKAQGYLPSQKQSLPTDVWDDPRSDEPDIDLMALMLENRAKAAVKDAELSDEPSTTEDSTWN